MSFVGSSGESETSSSSSDTPAKRKLPVDEAYARKVEHRTHDSHMKELVYSRYPNIGNWDDIEHILSLRSDYRDWLKKRNEARRTLGKDSGIDKKMIPSRAF